MDDDDDDIYSKDKILLAVKEAAIDIMLNNVYITRNEIITALKNKEITIDEIAEAFKNKIEDIYENM